MQIIYAAPFILLSLICFSMFLAVPSLRRFAIRALVAPVAFGFCGIVGWLVFALAGVYLKLALTFGPLTGVRLAFAALIFYVLPGFVGAWLAVLIVKKAEKMLLKTPQASQFALRVVVSLISFVCGSVIGLGLTSKWLATDSLIAGLSLSLLIGGLIGIAAYFLTKIIQQWPSTSISNKLKIPNS